MFNVSTRHGRFLFPFFILTLLLSLIGPALLATAEPQIADATYYVATTGDDNSGDGSAAHPWATITHALDSVPDGSTILVKPGVYNGQVRLRGVFATGVTVRLLYLPVVEK